jgi:hypothetical protein
MSQRFPENRRFSTLEMMGGPAAHEELGGGSPTSEMGGVPSVLCRHANVSISLGSRQQGVKRTQTLSVRSFEACITEKTGHFAQ